MGLDIFAANHLRYLQPVPKGKALDRIIEELEEQNKSLYDVYFPLFPNHPSHRARLGGMKTGLYEYTSKSRKYSFRAGSYSGYNAWRNHLSLFTLNAEAEEVWNAPRSYRDQPFFELINFTDCDGRIGTSVAEKLAEDFTSHATRAKRFASTLTDPEDWSPDNWLEVYRDFTRGLRLAAKNGALTFC